jgi:hypothetical protein
MPKGLRSDDNGGGSDSDSGSDDDAPPSGPRMRCSASITSASMDRARHWDACRGGGGNQEAAADSSGAGKALLEAVENYERKTMQHRGIKGFWWHGALQVEYTDYTTFYENDLPIYNKILENEFCLN